MDGAVRLAGSNKENEGRVEICFNNQYGTICDDGWDSNEAAVICNQLGFQREGTFNFLVYECYMYLHISCITIM